MSAGTVWRGSRRPDAGGMPGQSSIPCELRPKSRSDLWAKVVPKEQE